MSKKKYVLDAIAPDPIQMQIHEIINMHTDGPLKLNAMIDRLINTNQGEYKCNSGKNKKSRILDIEAGFDIETTKVKHEKIVTKGSKTYAEAEYRSYMYIWQMVVADYVIIGRTWSEWVYFMTALQEGLDLYSCHYKGTDKNGNSCHKTDQRQILVWIFNSPFEFHFICNKLNNYGLPIVESVFATDNRKPLKFEMNFSKCTSDCSPSGKAQGAGFVVYDAMQVAARMGGLKTLAKNYCITQKAVGDLDYEKPRNSMTPLTDEELGYCYNDVIILHEWSRMYFDLYVGQCGIMPLTSTGVIREAVKHNFRAIDNAKGSGHALSKWVLSLMPATVVEYLKAMNCLFRGGNVHGNLFEINKLIRDIAGDDFNSSYPSVMNQCYYPITPFEPGKIMREDGNVYDIRTEQDVECFDRYFNSNTHQQKCWFADFTFKNIRVKHNKHTVENVSKIHEYMELNNNIALWCDTYEGITDNGKLVRAKQVTVSLTEQDWYSYKEAYEWDSVVVNDFRAADAGRLPDYLLDVVNKSYITKSELKKKGLDETIEYKLAKERVNGCFGLTVQRLNFEDIDFSRDNGEIKWKKLRKHVAHVADAFGDTEEIVTTFETALRMKDLKDPAQLKLAQEKYEEQLFKKSKTKGGFEVIQAKTLLSPYWGIWVTAHARRRILQTINYLGRDFIYCDTDSVYYKNPDKHKAYFENWNKQIEQLNRQLFGADFDNLGDLGMFDSVVIKWEDEKTGTKGKSNRYSFKTLGAKRYIKADAAGHFEVTIAGLPKGSMEKAARAILADNGNNDPTSLELWDVIEQQFTGTGMEVAAKYANKLTTSYKDSKHADIVIDEFGNREIMEEDSSVSLYEVPFTMTIEQEWLLMAIAMNLKQKWITDYKPTKGD